MDNSMDIDLDSDEFGSPDYIEWIRKLQPNLKYLPDIKIEDGFVYKRVEYATGNEIQEEMSWKLWVPKSMTEDLIRRAHDHPLCAHGCIGKTLRRIKTFYFWPKMTKQISNYVLSCETCKQTKSCTKVLKPATSVRIFQKLYLGLLGPYPRSIIL